MRKMIYTLLGILTILAFCLSCSNDSDSNIIRYSTYRFEDFKVYVGKPGGGDTIFLDTAFNIKGKHIVHDVDSLKRRLLMRHFSTNYSRYASYFGNITFEFVNDDLLAYSNANENAGKQIISTYSFGGTNGNDSLFIDVLGKGPKFVAEGSDKKELRRVAGFMKYPASAAADWKVETDTTKLLTLDDSCRVIPGHGPVTTIGDEKLYNPFLN